jgi:hypothetical protein
MGRGATSRSGPLADLCTPPAKEHHMPETTSAGDAAPPETEDQAIRQRVKGLTSQVLQQGRVDPEAVRDIVRAVIGRTPGNAAVSGAEAREVFANAVPLAQHTALSSSRDSGLGIRFPCVHRI